MMLTEVPNHVRMRKSQPMDCLIDIHKGKRFLVCGTGYSLTTQPKEFYEGFDVVIGINGILGFFSTLGIFPHYHLFPDLRGRVIFDCETGLQYTYGTKGFEDENQLLKDGNLSKGISTITHCISLAYMLGALEINLLGVDCGESPEGGRYAPGCQIFCDSFTNKTFDKMADFLEKYFKILQSNDIVINDYSPFGLLKGCNKLGENNG